MNTKILPDVEGESIDAPKKFKNIDKEPFECTWDGIRYEVQPGEIVIKPKYLVNFLAQNLSRKMIKRALIEKIDPKQRQTGLYKIVDTEKEKELQEIMVADNFEKIAEETVSEEKPKKTKN